VGVDGCMRNTPLSYMCHCLIYSPPPNQAMGDYSVDNRGDVGSWVREAAMDGAVKVIVSLGSR